MSFNEFSKYEKVHASGFQYIQDLRKNGFVKTQLRIIANFINRKT